VNLIGMTSDSSAMPTAATTAATATSTGAPAIPQRPSTLNSVVNQTASNYSGYGAANRPYGASPYGGGGYGAGGYSSYSSPYNRMGGMYGGMGGMGGGMYGGMGGMGGMYGGGYGGMGGMGGGMYGGMPGDPNNPQSLTQSFNQSTQTTFQLIEGIVGAFGGFAQMLESTFMATHSSFFGMFTVAFATEDQRLMGR
jgi:peroxin-13